MVTGKRVPMQSVFSFAVFNFYVTSSLPNQTQYILNFTITSIDMLA